MIGKNFHRIIPLFAVLAALLVTATTTRSAPVSVTDDEIDAVNRVIDDFQTAYCAKKTTDIQNLFHYKAVVGIDFHENSEQEIYTLVEWIDATRDVFKGKPWVSDKLTNREIEVFENSMATVVCDYDYRDPGNHQSGVDIFTLMKIRGKWKIISLIFSGDSVRK